MCWTTIEITNSDELLRRLLSYDSGWLFRGHTSATWGLESTLERVLAPIGWKPDLAKTCEDYALHIFHSRAHHYISRDLLPATKLGWLSLMQHHGVPTRLLDFTESPFIGLFFAFDDVSPAQGDACAVWAIEYRKVMKASVELLRSSIGGFEYEYTDVQMHPDEIFEKYVDRSSHDVLWVTEPLLYNLRLERQKGTFLLSGNIQKRITDLLRARPIRDSIHKIVIPAYLADDVFHILGSMGIDSSRLFSDLDGMAKDIKRMMVHQVPNKLTVNL